MDATLFKKILDRRLTLQAELVEIDAFLRQAEALAARLFPPQIDAARGSERRSPPPDTSSVADSLRDNTNFSFSPLPGRL